MTFTDRELAELRAYLLANPSELITAREVSRVIERLDAAETKLAKIETLIEIAYVSGMVPVSLLDEAMK